MKGVAEFMEKDFDLVVIGSGPGGYVAAIQAAKLGMKTAIVEEGELGGTCLNSGCIPTKTLMHSSSLYYETQNLEKFGIHASEVSYDLEKIFERKDEVIGKIKGGIKGLLEANKVEIISGRATIVAPNQLAVKGNDELQAITTDKILIASGSKPILPKIEGIGLKDVVTSTEILSMNDKIYKKLTIIGGGVIGVEIATIYQELGCEVTIIEAMDRILPSLDKEISQSVAMSLKKRGIKIHTKAMVTRIAHENGLICEYEDNKAAASIQRVSGDGILVAIGRTANTEGLLGENLLIDMERNHILADENLETSVKGIYAIGDVIKGAQLAHVASAQGIVAVEHMLNLEASINLEVIPSCIYTNPEIAVVGMTETEAEEKGIPVKTAKYPMLGNSKVILSQDERGFIKLIAHKDTDEILGAQLMCPRATDMIGEFASAIINKLTIGDMARSIRPHPTYNEGINEALNDFEGMAIHVMPRRR